MALTKEKLKEDKFKKINYYMYIGQRILFGSRSVSIRSRKALNYVDMFTSTLYFIRKVVQENTTNENTHKCKEI